MDMTLLPLDRFLRNAGLRRVAPTSSNESGTIARCWNVGVVGNRIATAYWKFSPRRVLDGDELTDKFEPKRYYGF